MADGCCDCFSLSANNVMKIIANNLAGRFYLEVMLKNYNEHKCVQTNNHYLSFSKYYPKTLVVIQFYFSKRDIYNYKVRAVFLHWWGLATPLVGVRESARQKASNILLLSPRLLQQPISGPAVCLHLGPRQLECQAQEGSRVSLGSLLSGVVIWTHGGC